MGLERMAAVLQGVSNNYAIDLFHALTTAIDAALPVPTGTVTPSHRVIADHLRAIAFLMADQVMPSNEGRGYVLRRIMRRAMRHARQLGATDPLLHRLVAEVACHMGDHYVALPKVLPTIQPIIAAEETQFQHTLGRGLTLLEEAVAALPPDIPLPGSVAFTLYDTYGFPLDLTQDALRPKAIAVDVAGFEAAMAAQRARARAAWAGGAAHTADIALWHQIQETHGATEFLGYHALQSQSQTQAIVGAGILQPHLVAGEAGWVVWSQTPCYAESGGQVGDIGHWTGPQGKGVIQDTKPYATGLHGHYVRITEGLLAVGDTVALQVDPAHRAGVRAHHSSTHLLHAALRAHLGTHVVQKGSWVGKDRLRFDFSHPSPLGHAMLETLTHTVNAHIRANALVDTRLDTPEGALAHGAIGLFGEKYGEAVRVVTMGQASCELCGGTHVARTGDIGYFTIIGESAVAAGIRRIEAVAGEAAADYAAHQRTLLADAVALCKGSTQDALPARIHALRTQHTATEHLLGQTYVRLGIAQVRSMLGATPGPVYGVMLHEVPSKHLRTIAEGVAPHIASGVLVLGTAEEGKASLAVYWCGDYAHPAQDPVSLLRLAVPHMGGKGGGGAGRFAQAGGTHPEGWDAALDAVRQALAV
jgi:alanyl-tRNA synthetase